MLSSGITIKRIENIEILEINNIFCHAEIALQGGQILAYQLKTVDNSKAYPPLLWTTQAHQFVAGKAIRGGIPLCFPWFGAHAVHKDYPAHGFARQSLWQLKETQFDAECGHRVVLQLCNDAKTRQYWDHAFMLEMTITCGQALHLQLSVQNVDVHDFAFTYAWHSYFAVSDVRQIQVKGLEKVAFIDQLQPDQAMSVETNAAVIACEVDRIYLNAGGHYQIVDGNRLIDIAAFSDSDVVLWNPWIEKSKRLSDVADDAWTEFVCVESGKVKDSITVAAGQSCKLSMTLSQ